MVDDKTKDAAIIDPANPPEYLTGSLRIHFLLKLLNRVLPVLKSQIDAGKINLKSIINTHQ